MAASGTAVLYVINKLPQPLELFVQSKASVHSIDIEEGKDCFRFDKHYLTRRKCSHSSILNRFAGSMKPASREETPESCVFPLFMCPPSVASINMSARQVFFHQLTREIDCDDVSLCRNSLVCVQFQEVKEFQFNPGPIGMEVEFKNQRVLLFIYQWHYLHNILIALFIADVRKNFPQFTMQLLRAGLTWIGNNRCKWRSNHVRDDNLM